MSAHTELLIHWGHLQETLARNMTSADTPTVAPTSTSAHYLSPILTIGYFTLIGAINAVRLRQSKKSSSSEARRYTSIAAICAVIGTLVLQLLCYLRRIQDVPEWAPPPDSVIYCLSSILAHGYIAVNLMNDPTPTWSTYTGSWATAAVMEVAVLLTKGDVEGNGDARLYVSRATILLGLVVSTKWHLEETGPRSSKGLELPIALGSNTKCTECAEPEDDNFDDDEFYYDSDEIKARKELKAKRLKRFRESNSWVEFLSDYKIFVKLLWPSHDRKIQSCMGLLVVHMVAGRLLGVLVPRQLGIIINQLTAYAANGIMPCKAIAIWIGLELIGSSWGIDSLKEFAILPVRQFADKSISTTAFHHIMTLSMDFHNEKSSAELVRSVTQGQTVQELLDFVLLDAAPMLADLCIALFYISSLFDAYVTFIIVIGSLMYFWVGGRMAKINMARRKQFNETLRQQDQTQFEALANWQTVSHFNRGQYESNRYLESVQKNQSAQRDMFLTGYGMRALQGGTLQFARLAATALAMYRISQGTAPVGNLITFTAYWSNIRTPIAIVEYTMKRLSSMITDSERLLQLLKTKSSVVESPNAQELNFGGGRIEFDDVDFAYDERRPVLKGVSFVAEPGATVALVGETGGGKSTILKLLYRYYDVTDGSIRIDGQDIRNLTLDSLRNSFGMCPQDPSLFNATLMENLRYARLDATDDEIKEACKGAAIHDKIMTFPDQYQCKVGERGVKLSGGELQRVAIARAMLRQPKIVLLDEATSMVDAETEAEIQKALKRLAAGRTTLVIAHRLSTIQHADLILVINDGRIVEQGTHEELIRRNGKYVALWSNQMSKTVDVLQETKKQTLDHLNSDEDSYSADSEDGFEKIKIDM